jgi:hypothetical protein
MAQAIFRHKRRDAKEMKNRTQENARRKKLLTLTESPRLYWVHLSRSKDGV